MKNHLLIFAKYPEPGRVKTRLARQIGFEKAARLYQTMVETVVQKTAPRNGDYRRFLYFDPPERKGDFQQWFPFLQMQPQREGDLGDRMTSAIRESLESAAERVIVIGSDCMEIDGVLIEGAFFRLDQADVVVGPATDGGYYLIGMKKLYDLFTDIPWSTDRVFDETIRRANEFNLRVAVLPTLSDIDEIP